jgi:hypothetical protein
LKKALKPTSPLVKSCGLPSLNNMYYNCEEEGDNTMLQVGECAFAIIFMPHYVVIMKKQL